MSLACQQTKAPKAARIPVENVSILHNYFIGIQIQFIDDYLNTEWLLSLQLLFSKTLAVQEVLLHLLHHSFEKQ